MSSTIEIKAYDNAGNLVENTNIINPNLPSTRKTVIYYLENSLFSKVEIIRETDPARP